jgi:hypothetical protein
MRLRVLRTAVVVTALASATVVGGLAAPASAAPQAVTGGTTSTQSAPGLATTLLKAGIIPVVIPPGRSQITLSGGLGMNLSFPISGGSLDLATFTGQVQHRGGVVFVRLLRTVKFTDLVIDLGARQLTAVLNNGRRIPLFNLDLSAVQLTLNPGQIVTSNIGVTLTGEAAAALDAGLHTRVFSPGQLFGTGASTFNI